MSLRIGLQTAALLNLGGTSAESFAEQHPQDEDWALIRDLRQTQRDVYQVIYAASRLEWHYFWLKHLVPALKFAQDVEGMKSHVFQIARWGKADSDSVVSMWVEALALKWLNCEEIADQIGYRLADIELESSSKIVPLLERLLDLPHSEHGALGRVVARCVEAGLADDSLLWRYIAADINDDNVLDYKLNGRLHCAPHEFGDRGADFIRRRMQQSTELLDFAFDSIESWSEARSSRHGGGCLGML